jgi:probable HAF family extracellular repeat protein
MTTTFAVSSLRPLARLLITAALAVVGTSASAASYTFTELGTLGGSSSIAYGINDGGQVVGYSYLTGNGSYHATLWNSAMATDLGTLGGSSSIANGINNSGQVVGTSYTAGDAARYAALWKGGARINLGSLGGVGGATAINDAGQVVGYSDGGNIATLWNGITSPVALGTLGGTVSSASDINSSGKIAGQSTLTGPTQLRATLWNGTTRTNLGFGSLSGAAAHGNGINEAGQVVGAVEIVTDTVTSHAVLWDSGIVTDLGTLGGKHSSALAINNSGEIAGWSDVNGEPYRHATLWVGTTPTDLNSLLDAATVDAGWILLDAAGINDNGWITGTAYNAMTDQMRGYLLSMSSMPEPETYALMLAGLGVLANVVRRRKGAPFTSACKFGP